MIKNISKRKKIIAGDYRNRNPDEILKLMNRLDQFRDVMVYFKFYQVITVTSRGVVFIFRDYTLIFFD